MKPVSGEGVFRWELPPEKKLKLLLLQKVGGGQRADRKITIKHRSKNHVCVDRPVDGRFTKCHIEAGFAMLGMDS